MVSENKATYLSSGSRCGRHGMCNGHISHRSNICSHWHHRRRNIIIHRYSMHNRHRRWSRPNQVNPSNYHTTCQRKVNVKKCKMRSPSQSIRPKGWTALISVYLALSQTPVLHCETMDTGPVHRAMYQFTSQLLPVLIDDQAESTWLVGYIPGWFTCLLTVTHPSTNQAHHRVSLLMRLTT